MSAALRSTCVGTSHPAPEMAFSQANTATTLVQLADELIGSLMRTAVAASIAAAVAKCQPGCNLRAINLYYSDKAPIFTSSRLTVGPRDELKQLMAALSEYYLYLNSAHMVTVQALNTPRSEESGQELQAIAQAWRLVAQIGLSCLDELTSAGTATCESACEAPLPLRDALIKLVNGHSPCVDAYGNAKFPARFERRSNTRQEFNRQAFFLTKHSVQRAAITNVSDHGIGVEGLRDVEAGMRVELLLRPGISIAGAIAWVKDGKQGIKLDAPLPSNPAFSEHLH